MTTANVFGISNVLRQRGRISYYFAIFIVGNNKVLLINNNKWLLKLTDSFVFGKNFSIMRGERLQSATSPLDVTKSSALVL